MMNQDLIQQLDSGLVHRAVNVHRFEVDGWRNPPDPSSDE